MKLTPYFLLFALLLTNPLIAKGEDLVISSGKQVKFDYTLIVDGEVADTSSGKGPLAYVHGQQQIIPGLERQMEGLKVGDQRDIIVNPEDGYGKVIPDLLVEVAKERLNPSIAPEVGMQLDMQTEEGHKFSGIIKELKEETILLDFNHPLAGKELVFKIKVVEVK